MARFLCLLSYPRNIDRMKSNRLIVLLLFCLIMLWSGCQKLEDTVDQETFANIKFPSLLSNSYTSIVATRKDASAEITLSYFDPEYFYKERNYTVYPDYYEVYLSMNTPDNWEMIKTIDTSYINKSLTISGLTNGELYYVYIKEINSLNEETKNTNVAVFIPSAYKPTYNLILRDFYGHDLYSFDINSHNNRIVYATKYYEYKPGYSAASIFLSDSGAEPQLVDIVCWFPSFSIDGEKVSYSSNKGEVFDGKIMPEYIAVYDISTNKATRLTSDYSVNKYPSWSPDNYSIAFSSSEQSDEGLRITLLNPETHACKKLQTEITINQDIISYSQEHPAWSPDGEYIYYTQRTYANANINPGYFDIYRIKSIGGIPEPIFNSNVIECTPAISPDNSKLAFLADFNGKLQVWIYNFLDNEFYQPFDTNNYQFSEIWSLIRWKNNNTILFTASTESDAALFSITIE